MTGQAVQHLGLHRYEVRHVTAYTYTGAVTASLGRACLRPRDTPHQRVADHAITVSPEPVVFDEHTDAFGNSSHYIEIDEPHHALTVTKTSTVEVTYPRIDLNALDAWTVSDAAARIAADATGDALERSLLTLPSELVDLGPEVRDFAASIIDGQSRLGAALLDVTGSIYRRFTYAKGATSTRTRLPELLAQRAGVCQDFAHLAVAVFRSLGLPARYVSGYIETSPPPGQDKLAGSDATHAWAAVLTPGGQWVDLDPTNDQVADSRYITTAWGRDFLDVSPLKGVIFSEGTSSTLSVGVDVMRLPDPPG